MDKMTLISLFQLGGWSMWPLLAMSIVTVAVTIERAIYFLMYDFKVTDIEEKVIEFLKNDDRDGAQAYLKTFKKKKLAAHIILEGVTMAKLGEHRMEKAFEAETQKKVKDIEKGLNYLVEMGSIAPITGFLGTVSGMIGAFGAIAKATDVNAQLVAGGIFEALITTAYGLIIAVVSITAYNVFTNIVERFITNIERVGTDVVTTVLIQEHEKNNK
ncbi:MAG: biopolymer transporter [Spirochaetes bacterium RIFOXYB1_FULL_32_8]|nr:MAG: biopolymer transporter [Spirochaetes bacterium GWE1_32_154]OHD47390.1 MAG: biopolymer transporter [Spirochaetes bacterium GWE2_31_10]OHD81422.1 MAG: biopolymer transporter [Spirochaetes bacterium RIFOXYB1_FULL_32_8]HBI37190.1 MotA/TolQ/ExbB proton channel family protein [Spirochaetia bacterium]